LGTSCIFGGQGPSGWDRTKVRRNLSACAEIRRYGVRTDPWSGEELFFFFGTPDGRIEESARPGTHGFAWPALGDGQGRASLKSPTPACAIPECGRCEARSRFERLTSGVLHHAVGGADHGHPPKPVRSTICRRQAARLCEVIRYRGIDCRTLEHETAERPRAGWESASYERPAR